MKVYCVYHSLKYCEENYHLADFGAFFLNGHQKAKLPYGVPANEGISTAKCGTIISYDSNVLSQAVLLEHFKAWKGFTVTPEDNPEYFI